MFKDRYFQSSEILQNAVKCIDYVEPRTLRELAQYVLIKVMKLARHRVDLVFDTYKSPSI